MRTPKLTYRRPENGEHVKARADPGNVPRLSDLGLWSHRGRRTPLLRTGDGAMRRDRQIRDGLDEAGWHLADHQRPQLRAPRRDACGTAKRHWQIGHGVLPDLIWWTDPFVDVRDPFSAPHLLPSIHVESARGAEPQQYPPPPAPPAFPEKIVLDSRADERRLSAKARLAVRPYVIISFTLPISASSVNGFVSSSIPGSR